MYIPKKFKWEDKGQILEFINQNPFGLLCMNDEPVPSASHLPFFWEDDGSEWGLLTTHVAKGNRIAQLLDKPTQALVVLQGSHGYVSPSWYDHVNVPTWNYVSCYLTVKACLTNRDETVALLTKILHHYEQGRENGRKMEDYTEEFLESHYQGLYGIKLEIVKVEGAIKLSQNRDKDNFERVVGQFENSSNTEENCLAKDMKRYVHKS